jgi:hypothetical protein
MPMLVLLGDKAGGTFLIEQARLEAFSVRGEVTRGRGHFLMEEAPPGFDMRVADRIREAERPGSVRWCQRGRMLTAAAASLRTATGAGGQGFSPDPG